FVDDAGDVVVEAAGGGTADSVQSSVSYTLSAEIELLTLNGTGNINGTGNGLDNIIAGTIGDNILDGGAGADRLSGGLGNDTYIVDNVGDVVTELAGTGTDNVLSSITYTLASEVENLTLTGTGAINGTGNVLANVITGNSGNILDGGAGADTMAGGIGNDTYIVDNAGDVIVENAGAGVDTVQASFSYTLAANIENLTLTGTGALNGTGNSVDNVITGNSGNNVLDGGAGNDTLVGGGGTDAMTGGAGNDIYVVDDATDTVTEAAGGGTDTVQSSISYTLGSEVENLV